MKAQEFEQMELKAKTFACSILADSSLLSKKREKQIRDYLKKNNFLKSDSESNIHEKIKQFKTCVCFNNIYTDRANDILIQLSDGKYDFLDDTSNTKFFDFDKNDDFTELTKNLKQTNKIMEDLKKEEDSLHEKRKDDPELDNSLKDIEKKMFRNPKYSGGMGEKLDLSNLDFTTEREEREKREKMEKLKKFGKYGKKTINDSDISFKDIIENPELLRKFIGIKTIIGFIIFMIIISIIDNRNQKRIKEEEEKLKNKEKEKNNPQDKKEENKEENNDNKEKNNKKENLDNVNKDESKKEKVE
jgi:uncharacterized membrane protein YciS (DUF1049 family)